MSSPTTSVQGLTPFERGDSVEVFDVRRQIWIPAVVFGIWEGVYLDDGERYTQVDVDGTDDLGPFRGRWDLQFVRHRGVA